MPLYTLLIGFFAGAISGVFYLFSWWTASLLFFVFIYLIENIRKPILTGYVADKVPEEILASIISVQTLLQTVFTALIALVFGILADWLQIGPALLIVSAGLLLLTLILNLLGKVSKNQIAANS